MFRLSCLCHARPDPPPALIRIRWSDVPLPRSALQPHLDKRAHCGTPHRHTRGRRAPRRARARTRQRSSALWRRGTHGGRQVRGGTRRIESGHPGVPGDARGFDLVVSISTLEHTGFEEEVPDPDKPARAAAHLAGLLAPGGTAIVTFPLGYNPALDALVASRPDTLGKIRGLRRVSADNRWIETEVSDLLGARYGSPYPNANALVVATISIP